MRIKSLILQNIRSYVEQTITFPEGSVLLAGDIGAGKSTLLLAIEFALFGTKRGELEASSLLRHGAHAGKIELTCAVAGKEIRICRILKRTSTTIKQEAGVLVCDGQRQDLTPVELRAKIVDILGYPKETQALAKDLLFRYTVFTPQEQMRQILYDDKETRLNTIRRVFQMDKYKKIRDNAQVIGKELRLRRKGGEETLAFLPQLEQQLLNLQKNREQKEQQHQQLLPLFIQVQQEVSDVKAALLVLEEKQKEQQLLLQKQAALRSQESMLLQQKKQKEKKYQELQKQLVEVQQKQIIIPEKPTNKSRALLLQELDELQKKLQQHLQEKALLAQQQQQLFQQRQVFQNELLSFQNISQELAEYEQQLVLLSRETEKREELEKNVFLAEQQLGSLLQDFVALDITEKNILHTKTTFEQLDTCSLCKQHVAHSHKQTILTQQQEFLEKTTGEKQRLATQKESCEKKLVATKAVVKQLIVAEKKKAVLVSVVAATKQKQQQYTEKQKQFLVLEQQLLAFELQQKEHALFSQEEKEKELLEFRVLLEALQQWEQLSQQKKQQELLFVEKQQTATQCTGEIQDMEQQLLVLQEQLASFSEQLRQYDLLEQQLVSFRKQWDELQQQERQSEITLKTLEKECEGLLQQQIILEKEVSEKKKVQQKCTALGTYAQWLEEYFVPMISLMEQQVLLQVHNAFQEFFSKWFTMLMEDTGIVGTIDETFTPRVEQNGYDVELLDLSGGEKTAVALAYRLALNKVINDFMTTIHTKDVLILDEPTDGFSAEQLEKVREVLEELQMKQVIVVSHEAKVESFVDQVLRIEKVGYVSRICA